MFNRQSVAEDDKMSTVSDSLVSARVNSGQKGIVSNKTLYIPDLSLHHTTLGGFGRCEELA